jgi:hypothetical protein
MADIAEGTLLASGSRTTTQTLDPRVLGGLTHLIAAKGVSYLDVTIDTTVFGTGSVTPSIEFYDEAAGTFAAVLTGAAIVATGRVTLRVGIDATPTTNLSVNLIPAKRWRVVCTANNANAQTYSVSARVLSA